MQNKERNETKWPHKESRPDWDGCLWEMLVWLQATPPFHVFQVTYAVCTVDNNVYERAPEYRWKVLLLFSHLFSCFFSRAPRVWHCAPDYRSLKAGTVSPFLCPWYPGWRKSPQEIIHCLNLEVGTEEGKQMTTEKIATEQAQGKLWALVLGI